MNASTPVRVCVCKSMDDHHRECNKVEDKPINLFVVESQVNVFSQCLLGDDIHFVCYLIPQKMDGCGRLRKAESACVQCPLIMPQSISPYV